MPRNLQFTKRLTAKQWALVLFLTVVFLIDDVLIYLLLKNAFQWRTNAVLLSVGATLVGLLNLFGAVIAYRAMRRKPTTGAQGMIGKTGVVLRSTKSSLAVEVQGEIWQAESSQKLKAGEKVWVESIRGLKLRVKRSPGSHD